MVDPLTGGFEVAKCLFAPCLDPCLAPVRRRCDYVTSFDDYVSQLEHQAKKLDNERQTKQGLITQAKNNGKKIYDNVEKWMKEAEADSKEARRVLNDNETATRFHGWLLNPKKRYRLGKDGKTIADRIKKLLDRIPSGKVYDDPPPALVDGGPPVISSARDTIVQSRDSILRNIMSALDDEKNKVIGIHGPGGVGKTTLLETVEKKLRIEKRPFHRIAKAKVSQAPDLKQIQVDIARNFGLDLMDEPNEANRRDRLLNILQEDRSKKVLVILDDLWKELDLEAVGIPSGEESSGCQVLLTSRDEDVLQKTGASLRFHLEGLSTEEAFSLFEKTYGPDKLTDEGYEAKAAQVVAKLAGLPLLIKSVASTLKCGGKSAWENALKKIKDPNINDIVKWSYDHLGGEETKSLFLLCGFIGGSIRFDLLLGLGMGLGLFEEFDKEIRSSRNELNEMLRRLRAICLLQDGGDDKESVTIHDLYSYAVISTPLTSQNSLRTHRNAGSWPKEKLEKCWVCLVNVGSDRLAELSLHWFPDSNIFMLSEQHAERDCDGLDFTSMKELRVLYLRSINFTGFRNSDEILMNLHSLYLDHCHVNDVAVLGRLKTLQILSFAGSSISSLPEEIGKLTKLKLLNLSYCGFLQEIKPGVLKYLINLEELYMRGSFYRWMREDEISSESSNAKLAELKSLTKLTALEISILDPTLLLEDGDLPFGNLIRFWINIGKTHGREFEGLTTMKLNLQGCDGILLKEWVQNALQKTEYLHLDGFREIKSAHELCSQGFPKLTHLDIQNCSSIKHIVSSPDRAFPLLESLFLENLSNLEKICDGPECFSKLKVIGVTNCSRLEYIWCLSQRHDFAQVEEIEVRRCDSMRAIIIVDARKDRAVADNKVALPSVHRLILAELPKITSFCIGVEITSDGAPLQIMDSSVKKFISYPHGKKEAITATSDSHYNSFFNRKVSLPSLEKLRLESIESFKSIWPRELPESSLDNLVGLFVSGCSKLLNIFPSTITGRLHNLSDIWIHDCPSLESVFECGSLNSNTTEQTGIVSVSEAIRLSHVVKSDSQTVLGLPNLEFVYVSYCSELRYLFPYAVATTLEKLKSLYIGNCEQMKEVVAKDESDRSEAGVLSFPFLTNLTIYECPSFGAFIPNLTSVERSSGETAKENDESRQPLFNEMVTFPTLSKVQIKGVRVNKLWNNQIHDDSFCKLRSLELMDCDNLQLIAPSQVWKRLQCLQILEVKSCRSIEIIYKSDAMVAETGQLRSLILHDLENLRHIWRYDSLLNINVPFPNLRDIEVQRCPRLRMLFETFTASFLGQIKWLWVETCDDMELIADHGESEEATCTTITFSELDALILRELPNFRRYLPEKYRLECPSLRALTRLGCGKEPDHYGPYLVGWVQDRWRELIRDGK